jgi:hypothetical protein
MAARRTRRPAASLRPRQPSTYKWRSRYGGMEVSDARRLKALDDEKPFAYLRDVLERMSNGHPMNRLDELLPWNWPQLKAAA